MSGHEARMHVVEVVDATPTTAPHPNLLTQETVLMTVLAQDPSVVDDGGPVRAAISVPAGRLQRGPRGHRLHVVDLNVGTNAASPPVVLHAEGPWVSAMPCSTGCGRGSPSPASPTSWPSTRRWPTWWPCCR